MIIAQGGRFGGWALYLKTGPGEVRLQPARHAGIRHRGHRGPHRRAPTRSAPSSPTTAAVSRRAAPSPCTTTASASAPAGSTSPSRLIFSADETTDIGNDYGMPVSTDYAGASRFNGRIDVVQIDVGDDDQSHLIDPEQVAMVAISRQ